MSKFLQTNGSHVLDANGQKIRLRGFGFGNQVWDTKRIPVCHHSEKDYDRIHKMGLNAIRFYLNYYTFENDPMPTKDQSDAWEWLDQNIKWAKKHRVYLILNLHIAPGGFQSLGEGDALWDEKINQDKIIDFWKTIAVRYKDEEWVAGYALLNEPVPSQSISQWQNFAQRITNEIRKVDFSHIIFVERAHYVKGQKKTDANLNFPLIKDSNVIYEFHTYQPYSYTHQLLEWSGQGDGGKYPDPEQKHFINEAKGYDNSNEIQYPREKSYLHASIVRFVNWGKSHNVPVYMGEFGTCTPSFKNNKGGIKWVKDVLDIIDEYELSYTYHAWHEDTYGLFYGSDQFPDPENANHELIELFKR